MVLEEASQTSLYCLTAVILGSWLKYLPNPIVPKIFYSEPLHSLYIAIVIVMCVHVHTVTKYNREREGEECRERYRGSSVKLDVMTCVPLQETVWQDCRRL